MVRSISDIGIGFKLRLRPKYEAICRTTEVEHAQLVAHLDRLSLINCNLAGRHVSHSNGDKAHQTNGRFCLNEAEHTCGRVRDDALRVLGRPGLKPMSGFSA